MLSEPSELKLNYRANRIQVKPILPCPEGVSLRSGSNATMPDILYGKGYKEFNVTNESLSGILRRAEFVKKGGNIEVFIGVGTAVKVALQAAVLEPLKYLSLVDISGQNTYEAVLLFSALRNGYTVSDYINTREGKELYTTLNHIYPDQFKYYCEPYGRFPEFVLRSERLRKSKDDISSLDHELILFSQKLGIPIEKIIEAIQKVEKIEVSLDSILSSDVLGKALSHTSKGPNSIVIDASNVPIKSPILDESLKNPIIFFGFNAQDEIMRKYGVPEFGEGQWNDVRYWNFPPNDQRTKDNELIGGMVVGMAEYKRGYQALVNYIDSIDLKW
jgi:hypothetical protein